MLAYLALGVLLLLALLGLGQLFVNANPRLLARSIKAVGLVLAALLVLLAAVSGRAAIMASLAPVLAVLAMAWRRNQQRHAATAGPAPGQTSGVTTRYFRMILDHDSGALSGEVTAGRYAGRSLSELTRDDLLELRRECASDAQSLSVLEAYLDRLHPDWRQPREEEAAGGAAGMGMSREEARAVLGVGPDATPEEVREAHRRLMQKLHPDRGGSTYLAAQINRARDLLLEG